MGAGTSESDPIAETTDRHSSHKEAVSSRWHPSKHTNTTAAGLLFFGIFFTIWYGDFFSFTTGGGGRNGFQKYRAELEAGHRKCEELYITSTAEGKEARGNPRWNPVGGQQKAILIRNATLFDGDNIHSDRVDIEFVRGVVKSIRKADLEHVDVQHAQAFDAHGNFVTPGLVDMHSHHLMWPFHAVSAIKDVNEAPLFGPLTPYVRAIDGFKPYDPAIEAIASGGVTSSLMLPGSTNIIGGQAFVVKNSPVAGQNKEPIVEDLLLDNGLPTNRRQRYLKMACGENPKRYYGHTRLGNIWLLRKHLAAAEEQRKAQDSWCRAVSDLQPDVFPFRRADIGALRSLGAFPDSFHLEATIAMLRGQFNVNIHCYEPEDLERMLNVLHEFGVQPRAFHHALDAWQVPELLKAQAPNITIATFAENAFFKHEAWNANLRAGKILDDHGIAVAYKSDHTGEENNAKYLLHQAAVAHKFGLPAIKALQSVTSIPARSLQQDHRIGFLKPGYDADLVLWDSHPLSIGATAVQVFIDGAALLPGRGFSTNHSFEPDSKELPKIPGVRPSATKVEAGRLCGTLDKSSTRTIITGLRKVLLDYPSQFEIGMQSEVQDANFTVVLEAGNIICAGEYPKCQQSSQDAREIHLQNGYLTPGLVAVSRTLGLVEIGQEATTSDGFVDPRIHSLREQDIDFAKYGVKLDGPAFQRARIGGITKAIVPPILRGGLVHGVSVGISTSARESILDGGIFQGDVAVHVTLAQSTKLGEFSTISGSIGRLRSYLSDVNESTIFARVNSGELPLVIHAVNTDVIRQLILLKRSFPKTNLVIFGGHGAPLVAKELAEADIPVILTANRGAPDTWEKKDALIGPPLTESPAQVLTNARVRYGLAVSGDAHIHNLAAEAGWAAKFAGLNETEALKLVSRNLKDILGIHKDKGHGDLVFWEGNPLKGEGSVALTIRDDGIVDTCWPDAV